MQTVKKHPLWFRLLIGIGVPVLCLSGVFILLFRGSPFFCPFYTLTGLYCPGCGSGRAATALVHLDLLTALRNNMMFVLCILPCGYYLLKLYIKAVFAKDVLPWKDPPLWVYKIITTAFILFWILRNLPFRPFLWLAPI